MTLAKLDMPPGWENFWWCWEPDCGARACPLPGVGVLEAIGQHRATQHPEPEPEPEKEPACPRCGARRWVSVSLNGGWTRIAQCVPCGAYGDKLGPGWKAGG